MRPFTTWAYRARAAATAAMASCCVVVPCIVRVSVRSDQSVIVAKGLAVSPQATSSG
jgi:hypothetical protein